LSRVKASVEVPGRISEAEGLWYDLSRWPAFVDGFSHVVRVADEWPAGGRLTWDSTPHGRGRVIEQVTRHEQRVGQTALVEDSRLRGKQIVEFEGVSDATRVTLALEYTLKNDAPLAGLTDLFFIRRAVRESLERTLARFARERRGDAELIG
jgi:polyketide cyclase/dehydrase/lipid transport protein